jgi:hypothetical protein
MAGKAICHQQRFRTDNQTTCDPLRVSVMPVGTGINTWQAAMRDIGGALWWCVCHLGSIIWEVVVHTVCFGALFASFYVLELWMVTLWGANKTFFDGAIPLQYLMDGLDVGAVLAFGIQGIIRLSLLLRQTQNKALNEGKRHDC